MEEQTEVIEKVDGRTTEGKIPARLKKTEDLLELLAERTERICDTLADHEKRIDECSVRR